MPTYNSRGFPLYSDGESFPGWGTAFNSQSNLLATAMDVSEAAEQDNDKVATVAALPVTGNWVGRLIFVEENTTLYVCTGLPGSWGVVGGPTLPSFRVVGSGTHSVTSTITTITEWAAPEKNVGFDGWASGVLTIDKAGDYMIVGALVGSSAEVQAIIRRNSTDEVFGSAGPTHSNVSTILPLVNGDTLALRSYSNVPTSNVPARTNFAVRYLGT